MVDSLNNGTLVTPVFVNDRGPFLFAIDPDARDSIIDVDVAHAVFGETLDLYNLDGDSVMEASGGSHSPDFAATLSFRVGSLTVHGQAAAVTDVGFEQVDGQPIRGVLGRNVFADSLVFGFNRDLGMGYLSTQEAFSPPANSSEIEYSVIRRGDGLERRVAPVIIDGGKFNMHLSLSQGAGQLRRSFWDALKLRITAVDAVSIDDTGIATRKKEATVANNVVVGTNRVGSVVLFPYQDQRWDSDALDGSLGLDFFRRFVVWVNWDAKKYYLSAREMSVDHTAERIARWGISEFSQCTHVGCVMLSAVGEPAQPVTLTAIRDANAPHFDFEIIIAVTPALGGAPMPPMVVNLPYDVDRVERIVDASYIGATFTVKDMSPFMHMCPADAKNGCITPMATGPVPMTRTQ